MLVHAAILVCNVVLFGGVLENVANKIYKFAWKPSASSRGLCCDIRFQ